MADEALLDQRLEGRRGRPGDLFGGFERAAPREDREPREEPPLLGGEQVVRPLDRRPQRPLARFRVAAALEEIEPLGEALEDLPG